MQTIQTLLTFQNEIKLHHWGTSSYASHMALGQLYEGLDPLIDSFTESYMGVAGKNIIKNISTLNLNGPAKIGINSVLNSFEDFLKNEVSKEIGSGETSLLNIRDEMLGLVQQTKYLLTLS